MADWKELNWEALERLRGTFLAGGGGRGDYWRSEADLAAYDATFARRIGWKWDFVLADLRRRGWSPPAGEILDWGCGSGIAGRRFLAWFHSPGEAGLEGVQPRQTGAAHTALEQTPASAPAPPKPARSSEPALGAGTSGLVLHDRSALAMAFAARRAKEEFPAVAVRCEDASDVSAPTMLISHVIGELSPAQLDGLLAQAIRATAVVWVEPGAHEDSRRLLAVRERLRGEFRLVGPCTHYGPCGLLAAGGERHWCHHFAATPAEVFMDGDWARFARLAGIDLRSLPLSWLAMDKRPPAPLPAGAARVIGRPRVTKDAARLFACDASGVRDRRLAKRRFPQEYRLCKRGDFGTLQDWALEGDEIVAVREIRPGGARDEGDEQAREG